MQPNNHRSHSPNARWQTHFNDQSFHPHHFIQAPGQNMTFPYPPLEAPPGDVPEYTIASFEPRLDELSGEGVVNNSLPPFSQIAQVKAIPPEAARQVEVAAPQQISPAVFRQSPLATGTGRMIPDLGRPASASYIASDSVRHDRNMPGSHFHYPAPMDNQAYQVQRMIYAPPQYYGNGHLQVLQPPPYDMHVPPRQTVEHGSFGGPVNMTGSQFLIPSATGNYYPRFQQQHLVEGPSHQQSMGNPWTQNNTFPRFPVGHIPHPLNGAARGTIHNMASRSMPYPPMTYGIQRHPYSPVIVPLSSTKGNAAREYPPVQNSVTALAASPTTETSVASDAFGEQSDRLVEEQVTSTTVKASEVGLLGLEQGHPRREYIVNPDHQSLESNIGASNEFQQAVNHESSSPKASSELSSTLATRGELKQDGEISATNSKSLSSGKPGRKRTAKKCSWRSEALKNLPSELKRYGCTTENDFIEVVTPLSNGDWEHTDYISKVGWGNTTLIIDRSQMFDAKHPWRNKTLACDQRRSYPCFLCNQSLESRGYRIKHMKNLSHGGVPIQCKSCGLEYSRMDAVERHKREKHKDE